MASRQVARCREGALLAVVWDEVRGTAVFTAVKVATLCPLVLPVSLDYRKGRALRTVGGKVVGTGGY
jgi:hypothetical protein